MYLLIWQVSSKSCSCFLFISSSHSKRLLMSPRALSNAVASHPIVSFSSSLFFSIHALSISLMISSVFVLLFMRNLCIFSTENPSSSPSLRYSIDTLSATASNSSGNTWTFLMRVTGWSWCAKTTWTFNSLIGQTKHKLGSCQVSFHSFQLFQIQGPQRTIYRAPEYNVTSMLANLLGRFGLSFCICGRQSVAVTWHRIICLNTENTSDKETYFLHLNIKVIVRNIHTSVYDKPDDFGFSIVYNFPWLSGDVPILPSYRIYFSQLVRFARCCISVFDFYSKIFKLPKTIDTG